MKSSSTLKDINNFRESLRGTVILPCDNNYDVSRRVYNAMIDKKPALIVKCLGVSDIIQCLSLAKTNNLQVAVRSSGHNVAGYGVCNNGIVIDLSQMKSVRVNPQKKTACAEPGVTWREFDHETQIFYLATPGGTVSSTSISGFTLGGGIGWLMGSCGLTCDNLISADLITATGVFVSVSQEQNMDLLWALRGGGGNFGIVTNFEFKLHEVRSVVSGSFILPIEQARKSLQIIREFNLTVPDEITLSPTFFTSELGDPYLSIDLCYHGDENEGSAIIASLAKDIRPLKNSVKTQSYLEWQRYLDKQFEIPMRGYWKTCFLSCFDDEVIELIVDAYKNTPSPNTTLIIEHFHGEVTRRSFLESSFGHRNRSYSILIATRWVQVEDDEINISWVRELYQALLKFSDGSGYLNYMGVEDTQKIKLAYGDVIYNRLVKIKNKYDPENLFCSNQNIQPSQDLVRV